MQANMGQELNLRSTRNRLPPLPRPRKENRRHRTGELAVTRSDVAGKQAVERLTEDLNARSTGVERPVKNVSNSEEDLNDLNGAKRFN